MNTSTKTIEANGVRFAYFEDGEGPLVIMLHGFPDNPGTWSRQVSALVDAGFRVVRPFMRGYHPTEIPKDGKYDFVTLGKDLIALAEALGDGPVHAIGHDLGAITTYSALAQRPDLFASGVSVAVTHPITFAQLVLHPRLVHDSFHLWLFQVPAIGQLVASNDEFALIDYMWTRWSDPATDNSEQIESVKKTLAAPGVLDAATLGYYRAFIGTPEAPGLSPELLQPIHVPMMVVYGEDDPIPAVLAEREEQYYPAGYEAVWLAQARHYVHRDQPDEVNRRLLQWLSSGEKDPGSSAGSPVSTTASGGHPRGDGDDVDVGQAAR